MEEMYGAPGDEIAKTFLFTSINHLWGGFLMWYGMVFNMPHIFLHGCLNEVGGLDIKDYIHIALWYFKICPDLKPWCYTRKLSDIAFPLLHHICPILGMIPIIHFYSSHHDTQLICLLLEGGIAIPITVLNTINCFGEDWFKLRLTGY